MKTYKKLLILVRNHISDQVTFTGLYGAAYDLWNNEVITYEEWSNLLKFIKEHRQKVGKLYDSKYRDTEFYWSRKIKQPRLDWCNYWIEKL